MEAAGNGGATIQDTGKEFQAALDNLGRGLRSKRMIELDEQKKCAELAEQLKAAEDKSALIASTDRDVFFRLQSKVFLGEQLPQHEVFWLFQFCARLVMENDSQRQRLKGFIDHVIGAEFEKFKWTLRR